MHSRTIANERKNNVEKKSERSLTIRGQEKTIGCFKKMQERSKDVTVRARLVNTTSL